MTAKADSVFRWTWDAPAAWAEAVHRLSYRGDRLSYLTLHWVPGTPREPMQRWVVFELIPFPAAIGSAWLRAQINQVMADPWGQAMHQWAAECILTRQVVPVPFWAVQGPFGGHKYRYTNEDREFAMWQGLSGEAPAVGDLAYAEWTPLTASLIRLHSLMTHRRHGTLEAERRERVDQLQRACRRQLLHQITESGVVDLAAEAAPLLWDGARRVEKDVTPLRHPAPVGDLTAVEAKYVETGTLDPTL